MNSIGNITGKVARSRSSEATGRGRFKLIVDPTALASALHTLASAMVTARGMTPDHEAMKEMCRKIAYWLTNPDAKPGLVLAGFPGTGKTTLLDAIGRILRTSKYESKSYIATDLPLPLVETPETYRDSVLHGRWATFLLLDDVGEEPVEVKDFGRSLPLFTKIVAERYRLMLPLVMTTNLNMQQIEERYGARTADRLREMSDVIIFSNNSYRR